MSLITFSLAICACFQTFGAAEISPFSPPFLRGPGEKAPIATFNYIQPQQSAPAPLIRHNAAAGYNLNTLRTINQPEQGTGNTFDTLANANPNNPTADMSRVYSSNVAQASPVVSDLDPSMEHGNPVVGGTGGIPQSNTANHQQYSGPVHGSPFGNSGESTNHAISDTRNSNMVHPESNARMARPQLRQLDRDTGRSNSAATSRRSSGTSGRRSRSNGRVSEGHRLITRALWRIFDALMEKNEKQELQGRMTFVESAIKDMITSDSKLEGLIEMIKEENMGQDQRLDELSRQLESLTKLIEEQESRRLATDQNDEELPTLWDNKPAYTSCPSPFETVNGECFYVAGETKRAWHDARRDCSKHGGDLAAPRNLESLKTYLQSLAYQPEYVWVGASRQGNGDWVWSAGPMDGRLVDMSEETWNEDLPNGLGNCMGLYEGAAYRAYDFHCTEEDLYACQFFL